MPLRPETIVEHGALWTVAINQNQNLLGKSMIAINRPEASVARLTVEEWLDLHHHIRRLRVALDELFAPDQYNYAFLMNSDIHVHLHVVPRYETARNWHGERFDDRHYGHLFIEEQRILPATDLGKLRTAIAVRLPAE
jgi:diadenosine tetraphosphate (Ap4A) HIT family hydrolase